MKKIKEKINKKTVALSLILVICLFVSVISIVKITSADEEYNATAIYYKNENSNLKSNNVRDAIDEINSKIEGKEYVPDNSVVCDSFEECKAKITNPQTKEELFNYIIILVVSILGILTIIGYIIFKMIKRNK